MPRSIFALALVVLASCLFLYDAVSFSRHEWGVFSAGFLFGGAVILLLTGFKSRSAATER